MPSLPPPHPSLPLPPSQAGSSSGPVFSSYYNSHYLQAYSPPSGHHPGHSNAQPIFNAPSSFNSSNNSRLVWYEPGNNRCSHPGCDFTGSKKTVETHMMDRHLIYPPGWDKQRKKSDWDADPSLKGKPVPIQGTNVILDSPEVVEAWIAERKRRFPTSARVEDKKRKIEEAVARGQLDITQNHRPNKRWRAEPSDASYRDQGRNDQRSNNCHRDRTGTHDDQTQRPRASDSGWPKKTLSTPQIPEVKTALVVPQYHSGCSSEDENDGEPEIESSKNPPPSQLSLESFKQITKQDFDAKHHRNSVTKVGGTNAPYKKILLQPKLPPRNPFSSRPTLLRNLLLPEIRITISNLSQAIHFLVDNDFLRDVELKPGQAVESNKIQVVGLEKGTEEDIRKPIS